MKIRPASLALLLFSVLLTLVLAELVLWVVGDAIRGEDTRSFHELPCASDDARTRS